MKPTEQNAAPVQPSKVRNDRVLEAGLKLAKLQAMNCIENVHTLVLCLKEQQSESHPQRVILTEAMRRKCLWFCCPP